MRVTLTRLGFVAAALMAGACHDGNNDTTAPRSGGSYLRAAQDGNGPAVRITSPITNQVVAAGEGLAGAGSLTGGSAFAITIEIRTSNAADVPAREATNIRNTALLGQPNPNIPGLSVTIDADLITPDGTIIPRNTNLANLFNTLGTDDTPGPGVTTWVGWHVLESLPEGLEEFHITASVRDASGRVGSDVVKVKVDKHGTTGQALTPVPAAVIGDGADDADGPEVTLIGPRDPSSIALGSPAAGSFVFFQVAAFDRSGAGIGVNENGAGITTPVGLIRDGTQLPLGGPNRNYPGLEFTVDVPFRRPDGVVFPAGRNLAPLFDLAGTALDHRGSGHTVTTATWVVGGAFLPPAGQTSITVTTRVTDNAGRTGSAVHTFGISPAADGQVLTPAP